MMSESHDVSGEELLSHALERLLQCTELNLDEIEQETRSAIEQALATLDRARSESVEEPA